ncbi:hypothetical protein KY366_08780 [Candidatus Woesearchaeota archaeon]|nr:hypothetical protein [Candidatus Woesearchaeota archaeon]
MYDKLLSIGIFDPLTRAHERLFELGLELAEELDVYVGKRGSRKELNLPYEVRRTSLELLADTPKFRNRLNVVPECPSMFNLSTGEYDGLLIGSDTAESCYGNDAVGGMHDLFYSKFELLVILQREGEELTNKIKEKMQEFFKIEVHEPISGISSTETRALIKKGENIVHLIPEAAYAIIEKNFDYFRDV